jgi:hypothetical protein
MVRRRACTVFSALGCAALVSILAPACSRDEEGSPATTRFSCTEKTCMECTHEAACFWSKSRRACQTGNVGCAGLDCVNRDGDCRKAGEVEHASEGPPSPSCPR